MKATFEGQEFIMGTAKVESEVYSVYLAAKDRNGREVMLRSWDIVRIADARDVSYDGAKRLAIIVATRIAKQLNERID